MNDVLVRDALALRVEWGPVSAAGWESVNEVVRELTQLMQRGVEHAREVAQRILLPNTRMQLSGAARTNSASAW